MAVVHDKCHAILATRCECLPEELQWLPIFRYRGGRVMRAEGYTSPGFKISMSDMSFKGWLIQLKGSPWVEMLATLEISRQRPTYDYMFFYFPLFRGWSWQPAHSKGPWWLLYCIWPYEDEDVKKSKVWKLIQQNPGTFSDYMPTLWKLSESNGFIPPNAQKPAHSVEQQASSHLLMDVARMLLGFLLVGFLISLKNSMEVKVAVFSWMTMVKHPRDVWWATQPIITASTEAVAGYRLWTRVYGGKAPVLVDKRL